MITAIPPSWVFCPLLALASRVAKTTLSPSTIVM